jgi:predicted  nucleic acid-binding Zn-ribbon protein
MQSNYQNVKTEEEYPSDYRKYGLLNKSLIDDETSHEDNKIKDLENKIKILENRNRILEDLCTNLRNSMKTVLENSVYLENEFNNTKRKLLQTEKALEEALG